MTTTNETIARDKYATADAVRAIARGIEVEEPGTRYARIQSVRYDELMDCADVIEAHGEARAKELILLHLRWAREDAANFQPPASNPHLHMLAETAGETLAYEDALSVINGDN